MREVNPIPEPFAVELIGILEQQAQFRAAYARHGQQPPSEWAAMTPFPFLAVFEQDDIAEFARDLTESLDVCIWKRDLAEYYGNLRGWESSAETYNDHAMLTQMFAPDEAA